MELKEIADLFLRINDKVHYYWNAYVIASITLFAGLIYRGDQLKTHVSIILTTAFLIISAFSLHGLYISYSLLHNFGIELKTSVKEDTFKNRKLLSRINKISFRYHFRVAFFIHILVDTAIIIGIWKVP